MLFFCWLKPGGSISKNGKLTRFVYLLFIGPIITGFIHLDGIGEKPCAEHHELNSN